MVDWQWYSMAIESFSHIPPDLRARINVIFIVDSCIIPSVESYSTSVRSFRRFAPRKSDGLAAPKVHSINKTNKHGPERNRFEYANIRYGSLRYLSPEIAPHRKASSPLRLRHGEKTNWSAGTICLSSLWIFRSCGFEFHVENVLHHNIFKTNDCGQMTSGN